MKKVNSTILMLAFLVAALSLIACSNDDSDDKGMTPEPIGDEVKVYFIYTLGTSNGSLMTRAIKTNTEVFDEFYEKIKTGELVAPSFDLTLTEINSGVVYSFKGNWNSHDLLTLRTGTYKIVGKSTAEGDNIQERCSFTFDEQIDISITSDVITLHAKYDSSLLILNNEQIQTLQNHNGSVLTSFFTFNTYRYAFVNGLLYNVENKDKAYILGKYTNNAEFKIFTGNLSFEKGKYYVYNNISCSFEVPPMEEGGGTNSEIEGRERIADAVDLGLPSGTLWATWNIGASAPEEYGDYFAWGEIAPKRTYNWSTYKFGQENNYTKYNSMDGLTELELEDDAAHVIWGDGWRMPTHKDELELVRECLWESVEINGISGYKITGHNGNSIFMPRGGLYDGTDNEMDGTNVSLVNSYGWYWSSTLNSTGSSYAQGLCFFPSLLDNVSNHERCDGHNIRPVRNK